MNLKKNGNVFTSKFVGTWPSSCEKRIYRAAVSQRLRNTGIYDLRFSNGDYKEHWRLRCEAVYSVTSLPKYWCNVDRKWRLWVCPNRW